MARLDGGPWQRIEWKAPESHLSSSREFSGRADVMPAPLRELVKAFGVPHVPETTPAEEALVYLRAGSEIEHALLVQYLYAAWSLGSNPIATAIVNIAIQEMCHFITVQNLMLFLGSMPSIARQDQDPAPTLDPFPFALRPFSSSVLEDFLLTEMPGQDLMTADQRAIMDPIIARARQQGRSVHPVGLIYAKLYWLFQENDFPTEEWSAIALAGFDPGRHIVAFPGSGTATTYQVDPVAERKWSSGHDRGGVFASVGSRDAALHTIFEIASQGEGVASGNQLSHFEQFIQIYKTTDFGSLPASNWPTDPFVSAQPSQDLTQEANRITNPAAAALARLLDLRYQIALTAIRASLSRDRTKASDMATRTKYVGWAFDEMLGFLKGLALGLANVPCKAGGGGLSAAPTFGLAGFVLPNDAAGLDAVLEQLHVSAAAAMKDALAAGVEASMQDLIGTMRQNDEDRFPARMS